MKKQFKRKSLYKHTTLIILKNGASTYGSFLTRKRFHQLFIDNYNSKYLSNLKISEQIDSKTTVLSSKLNKFIK